MSKGVFVRVCMWSVGNRILLRHYEGNDEKFIIQFFFLMFDSSTGMRF